MAISFLVRILASIQASLAMAQVCALDSRMEALTVFLKAVSLFTVTSPLMSKLALFPTYDLQFISEGIGVSFQDCLSCLLSLLLEFAMVAALVAFAFLVAHQSLRETFAIHEQAFGFGAFADDFLLYYQIAHASLATRLLHFHGRISI